MFNRIVVPLDGTPFAEEALTPARTLALVFNSRLVVVRAQELPALMTRECDAVVEDINAADAYLHSVVNTLRAEGFAADMLLCVAAPGAGITNAAAVDDADLIVMTSHLRWKLPDSSPTSVTLDVLARSRVPILVWRAEPKNELPRREMPIVVPLDGSPFAETALPLARALATAFKTYLVLVRAVEPREQRTAVEYLRGIASRIEEGGGPPLTTVVRVGTPLSVIDTVWREQNAAMVVIASHGQRHHGSYTGFLGSIAAAIVEEIEVPVLIAHPVDINIPAPGSTAFYTAPEHQAH